MPQYAHKCGSKRATVIELRSFALLLLKRPCTPCALACRVARAMPRAVCRAHRRLGVLFYDIQLIAHLVLCRVPCCATCYASCCAVLCRQLDVLFHDIQLIASVPCRVPDLHHALLCCAILKLLGHRQLDVLFYDIQLIASVIHSNIMIEGTTQMVLQVMSVGVG